MIPQCDCLVLLAGMTVNVFKCLNNLTDHDIHFSHNSDYHEYNTRSKNKLRLPKVCRNWGKYRVCYHE
jgi:hypothetical protein